MGFVWRGLRNYCLAPLLLAASVFKDHPRRGNFLKIKVVQFFDGLTPSQVNKLFIVAWVAISVIYYVYDLQKLISSGWVKETRPNNLQKMQYQAKF